MGLRRSFRRRPSWIMFACVGVLLFVLMRLALNSDSLAGPRPDERLRAGDANVIAIEPDGTIRVRQRAGVDEQSHDLPVRLLGVTFLPQGEQTAAERLRGELTSPAVRIELDQRRIDDARRYLAWVYCGDSLLNERVIHEGLATAENYPGDNLPLSRRLRAAEQDARQNHRGAWAE